jgi:hypothetical protein
MHLNVRETCQVVLGRAARRIWFSPLVVFRQPSRRKAPRKDLFSVRKRMTALGNAISHIRVCRGAAGGHRALACAASKLRCADASEDVPLEASRVPPVCTSGQHETIEEELYVLSDD